MVPSPNHHPSEDARKQELRAIWKHCMRNRDELSASPTCGCFFCLKLFPPSRILQWTDGHSTAICPYCSVDSVLAESRDYQLGPDLLAELKRAYFSPIST
jgi:hypothetical protein